MKTKPRPRIMLYGVLCVGILLPLLALSGCTDEQIEQMQQSVGFLEERIPDAQEVLAVAATQRETLDEAIAALPEGELKQSLIKIKAQSDAAVVQAMEFLEKAEPRLAELKASLATATDTLDVIGVGVETAAPYIPAPWGKLLLAGWGIVATVRARMNRKAGHGIAASAQPIFDAAKLTDEQKATIRAAQGATGSRIVDEAQGKKAALPI